MFKKIRAYYMEFALILGAVAIVTVVILTFSGPQIGGVFSSVTSGLGRVVKSPSLLQNLLQMKRKPRI
jgi:Flp pilus assembly pilin Flp